MKCKVRNGTINYEEIGAGHPIVILHAMGTDHRSMMLWLEPIFEKQKGFKRIYIDIPAHGKSSINKLINSSQHILENVLDCLDHLLPAQSFSLIGMSYGGYIAQGILHHRLNDINGTCFIAPALHKKERILPEKIVKEKDDLLLSQLDSDTRIAFETLFVYQNAQNLSLFLKEIQPGRLLANREFLASNWRQEGYFLKEEPLHDSSNLLHPTLMILGKQDSICGYEDHFELLKKFSNATFSILDEAGHMIPIEQRKLVSHLVENWLIKLT